MQSTNANKKHAPCGHIVRNRHKVQMKDIGKEWPVVIIDTREQYPLPIEAFPTITETLTTGDYGIQGFSDLNNPEFVVERKSLGDLISSLTFGRDRFMREVERMRAFRFRALLIEGREADVEQGEYRSMTNPESILGTLAALEVRTNLHVHWAGDRRRSAKQLERWVKQFSRGILKNADKLTTSKKETIV